MSAPTATMLAAWGRSDHVPTRKVEIRWDGASWTDETARVLSLGGVDGVDPITRYWQPAEVTIVLANDDRRFSSEYFSGPLYPYLSQAGQAVRVSLGYDGELQTFGTYWVESMTPSEAERTVSLRCLDRAGALAGATASLDPAELVLTSEAFRRLCDAAGLVEGVDYTVETGELTCAYIVATNAALVGELVQVAQAEGGRFFVDPDGILRLWNRSHHRSERITSTATITRSAHAYDVTYKRRDPRGANRVLLQTEQRTAQVSAIVCDQKVLCDKAIADGGTGLVNTGGANGGAWAELTAMDPVTYEVGGPVSFTTIATITCKTFPGGVAGTILAGPPPATVSPSNTVYYTWTPNGSTGILRTWSVSTANYMEVDFTINGLPQRIIPGYAVGADDLEAQAAAGGLVVPLEMRNTYLPIAGIASELAKDILLTRMGAIASVDLPAIDGLPWLHGYDVVTFVDDSVSPSVTYMLTVVRHEWRFAEDGFVSALQTAPIDAALADPAPLVVGFPVPSSSVASPTAEAPPWYWGSGSSQDGTWGFSEWG